MERLQTVRTIRGSRAPLSPLGERATTRLDRPDYPPVDDLLLCAVVTVAYGTASLLEAVARLSRRITARWPSRGRSLRG